MRYWRHLLLCVLIGWLPLQVLAGQLAPCPHATQSPNDTDIQAAHHGHDMVHGHDHHQTNAPLELESSPGNPQKPLCPHCIALPASTTHNMLDSGVFCDQCQCCALGLSPAFPGNSLSQLLPKAEHWPGIARITFNSHHSPPGLRPPLVILA